ncbi:MAG: chemotaxis response regulator protein-glutamate methylesterase [Deltaproteobacteria bacterium]|nr:chemotaxis response regulator protein-glutamate methylesterase [Deltaproteobacteria bacterium]
MSDFGDVKVLVIDDSAFNRQTITSILESIPGIRVVARAGDGDEGLKQVFALAPDVITLDLEMPKMDGFTFLRILMNRRPTPVIVISSYSRKENVFKALELGALDFIAKPTQKISTELREIERELVERVKLLAKLRPVTLGEPMRQAVVSPDPLEPAPVLTPAVRLIAIGASTGGPPALQQIFTSLDARLPVAIVVAQHMPAKFTGAFAERLDRASAFEVREAKHGDVLRNGLALIAPGSGIMTLVRAEGGTIRVKIDQPTSEDRFVPSIDKLFESAADMAGADLLGVVLTGMGGDGARGVRAIKAAGGTSIAEAADTAVIFGMPEEAIKTGAVSEILPLGQIPQAIMRWGGRR